MIASSPLRHWSHGARRVPDSAARRLLRTIVDVFAVCPGHVGSLGVTVGSRLRRDRGPATHNSLTADRPEKDNASRK